MIEGTAALAARAIGGALAMMCTAASLLVACGGETGPHSVSSSGSKSRSGSGSGLGSGYGVGASTCAGAAADAPAAGLDFSNNLIASPAPPGNLTPQNAPQIVVFGFDDIENTQGVAFVNGFLGGLTNPNATKGGFNVNPNACYAYSPLYMCGDGSLAGNVAQVTMWGPDFGNHTLDHLESNSTWSGIPAKYKDPNTGSWVQTASGLGPGVVMDQATWLSIINTNDAQLKSLYGVSVITGLRAPRLEINDSGLQALKAANYTYDEDLEELLPQAFVDAAVAADTAGGKGFNFISWPYTLDNGSPGVWIQQVTGDKKWVVDYPTGIWEIPVYQVYLPTAGGVGMAVANQMLAADKDCTIPQPSPHAPSPMEHCYLSDGEVTPGQAIKETTGFDFNTFVYSRMTRDQWLATMKHSFLIRYHGNRAPLTYGAHPMEYTTTYDNVVLHQANNYGFTNVVKYSTFSDRQVAMTAFRDWIQNDPTLNKDTYFLSAKQLADYMKRPFDKRGANATADPVGTPDSNGLFTRLSWKGQGAAIQVASGNSAAIVFDVASVDRQVGVSAGINAGSLANLTHIDVKYSTEVPFRIRFLTNDGSVSTTALLAGVGGDRLARIRIKDFFPGPESSATQVAAAGLVDASYMAKVVGIVFESAATRVTGPAVFHTNILQLTLHGASTASLCP
jgi:hypothetical protein